VRPAEPVTVSIPFGPGRFRPGQAIVVRQDGRCLPVQTRSLAVWPDGSTKWLLVDLQPDLPGNAGATLTFAVVNRHAPVKPPAVVTASRTPAGIAVDTGAISFSVPRRGFFPVTDVKLRANGHTWPQPFRGFSLTASGRTVDTAAADCELDLEESGPLRVVILVRGKHQDAAGAWIDFRGRVTAYAGKPYVEVEHQFIHAGKEPQILLESLVLKMTPQVRGQTRCAVGEGYYRTQVEERAGAGSSPLARLIDANLILREGFEHFVDCFYGDFWADWRDERGGIAVSLHQAHQNFPKGLTVGPDGILCQLYPGGGAPAAIRQGMAKTHRILLHFHGPSEPLELISVRSLQFQLPDRPALPHVWMEANDPWGDGLCGAVVGSRMLGELFARFMDRHTALGMMHFGDAPDAGYSQGRGVGQTVWINNEYDHAHICAQFHFQTGERAALESSLAAARHWLDVDLCHFSPNPLQHGGLWSHAACHAPAVGTAGGVTPSHEWVDGFLDYYFLTGRREGLDAAVSVAGNVLRQLDLESLRDIAQLSVRELGWALETLVAMALGTGEQRWKDAADEVVGRLLRWYAHFGSFLAPYTSHSMPRVPFMIAITGNSLARYTRLKPVKRIDELIVSMTDDLIDHVRGPDGIFVYKEFPSLHRPFVPPQILQLLTHAWRITGDLRYLRIGVKQLAYFLRQPLPARDFSKQVDPCGAVLLGFSSSSGSTFAFNYPGLAAFSAAARRTGLLKWLENPREEGGA
jgi:hypothetical protein